MSELTDDRLRQIVVALQGQVLPRRLDPTLVHTMATELLALRAAASTSTEGAGVKFDGIAKRKLDDLMARGWAIDGYAITKDGKHGFVTTGAFVGWWLPDQGMPSGLTPPASKVTTDEAEERG